MKELLKREKIMFYKTIRKTMYSTNFIFKCSFFHIAFYQIFKNWAILINHGSFFKGKDSLQLDHFEFLKMNQ